MKNIGIQTSMVLLITVFFLTNSACAQHLTITVTNPSSLARQNEPVVVEWARIISKLANARQSTLRIVDDAGRWYVYQADDIDQNGTPDEVVWLADFAPKQSRTFTVRDTTEQFSGASHLAVSTDAQNWKRVDGVLQSLDDDDGPGLKRDQTLYRFDGVGWESELVGYRVYLDERNAVDIQAKRRRGLQWKFIGSTLIDYQQNTDWGMDPLHVGPSLGVGGIAFWVGDSVHKPLTLERRRSRIIARGPVRAVVRVDYYGWDVGGEKVDVSSVFTIYAGERVMEHRVILHNGAARTLVTGIVKHDSSSVAWNPEHGRLTSTGKQSRAGDELFMDLQFSSKSIVEKAEDKYNDLVLIKLEPGKPLRFLISSVWEGETGKMWSVEELREMQKRNAARLNMSFTIMMQ
ncbi:MAG TPA: DUF4861 family protein [Bacteroidota bacterium]